MVKLLAEMPKIKKKDMTKNDRIQLGGYSEKF